MRHYFLPHGPHSRSVYNRHSGPVGTRSARGQQSFNLPSVLCRSMQQLHVLAMAVVDRPFDLVECQTVPVIQ